MITTILRRLLIIPAALIEGAAVALTGRECGIGSIVMDRKVGDPTGRLLDTRAQALAAQRRAQQRLDNYD